MMLTWFLFLFHLEATCLAQILNKLRNQHIIIYFLTILTRNLYVILKCTKGCVVFHYLRVCEQKPLKAAAIKSLQCKVVQPGPTNSGLWKVFRSWNWTFWSFHRAFFDPKWQPIQWNSGRGCWDLPTFLSFVWEVWPKALSGMLQGASSSLLSTAWEHSLTSSLIPLAVPPRWGLV